MTPYPTLVPYPTYTPVPLPTPISTRTIADTVIGQRWKVKVVKVETGKEFGTYYLPTDAKSMMVFVTVDYTYLGPGKVDFYPESVILVHVGTSSLTGFPQKPSLYKGDASSLDFIHFVDKSEEAE